LALLGGAGLLSLIYAPLPKAHETQGFVKALISTESDDILGFTAIAAQAGELMSVVQVAMLAKLPFTALRDAILAHPTMAEGLTVLFTAAQARFAAAR
jgi:pyruvate/2-oxoglutarate dehydrogenase complex dihydrolipoamide dehydrogenase (E3) component